MSNIVDKILLEDMERQDFLDTIFPDIDLRQIDALSGMNEDGSYDEDFGLLFPQPIKHIGLYD